MQDIDEDRREVKRLADRLRAVIDMTARPAACALAPIRWELMRRLVTLLTLEQLNGSQRRAAASDLLHRWKAHALAWTTSRVGAEWDAYAISATAMLTEISAFCDPAVQHR